MVSPPEVSLRGAGDRAFTLWRVTRAGEAR